MLAFSNWLQLYSFCGHGVHEQWRDVIWMSIGYQICGLDLVRPDLFTRRTTKAHSQSHSNHRSILTHATHSSVACVPGISEESYKYLLKFRGQYKRSRFSKQRKKQVSKTKHNCQRNILNKQCNHQTFILHKHEDKKMNKQAPIRNRRHAPWWNQRSNVLSDTFGIYS